LFEAVGLLAKLQLFIKKLKLIISNQ